MTAAHDFPSYSRHELTADGIIHGIGITGAIGALVWLASRLGAAAGWREITAICVYGTGLIGMLCASALYNFTPPGRAKAAFRKLDHAMIFVMIAGSYTPFVLLALPRPLGGHICLLVWLLAAIGAALKIIKPLGWDRVSLAMYLGLGWLVVAFLGPLSASLSTGAMTCLVLGGLVYSLGTIFHMMPRLRFHNAAWHGAVVTAAALHMAAIMQILPSA